MTWPNYNQNNLKKGPASSKGPPSGPGGGPPAFNHTKGPPGGAYHNNHHSGNVRNSSSYNNGGGANNNSGAPLQNNQKEPGNGGAGSSTVNGRKGPSGLNYEKNFYENSKTSKGANNSQGATMASGKGPNPSHIDMNSSSRHSSGSPNSGTHSAKSVGPKGEGPNGARGKKNIGKGGKDGAPPQINSGPLNNLSGYGGLPYGGGAGGGKSGPKNGGQQGVAHLPGADAGSSYNNVTALGTKPKVLDNAELDRRHELAYIHFSLLFINIFTTRFWHVRNFMEL